MQCLHLHGFVYTTKPQSIKCATISVLIISTNAEASNVWLVTSLQAIDEEWSRFEGEMLRSIWLSKHGPSPLELRDS